MAKKKESIETAPLGSKPTIHAAMLDENLMGSVNKGKKLTEQEAVALRKSGADIVVCGDNGNENRKLAKQIEFLATGNIILHPAHGRPNNLPHYQPETRPPNGHSFYEIPPHKLAKIGK